MIYLADVRHISIQVNTPIGMHWAFRIQDSNKPFVSRNRPPPAHWISIKMATRDVVQIAIYARKKQWPLDPCWLYFPEKPPK